MNQIGVFGGSFDPPHRAHERVAHAACTQLGLDRLLWIPARQPPHKPDRLLAEPRHRLHMVHLITQDVPQFAVDSRELDRPGPSFTVQTLESLHEEHPDARFWLILGSDNLTGFASWREPERILELASLAVYERQSDKPPSRAVHSSGLPASQRIDGAVLTMSSTDIRARVRRGQSTRDMLSPAVRAYIETNRLYQ